MEQRIQEVVAGIDAVCGTQSECHYVRGYPALINDAKMAEWALSVAGKVLGDHKVVEMAPVMGGEDFAYYLQQVPGAFLFFGMGDGMEYPHHHPRFDIDERALPPAALLMTALALEYLKEGSVAG
jgi:amidohydrolase